MYYSVSSELYEELAVRLREAIGAKNYFSGSVAFTSGEVECRLVTSVIVYRQRVSMPEGDCCAIANLVPVWWEFHTVGPEGETVNDLDFRELTRYVTSRC